MYYRKKKPKKYSFDGSSASGLAKMPAFRLGDSDGDTGNGTTTYTPVETLSSLYLAYPNVDGTMRNICSVGPRTRLLADFSDLVYGEYRHKMSDWVKVVGPEGAWYAYEGGLAHFPPADDYMQLMRFLRSVWAMRAELLEERSFVHEFVYQLANRHGGEVDCGDRQGFLKELEGLMLHHAVGEGKVLAQDLGEYVTVGDLKSGPATQWDREFFHFEGVGKPDERPADFKFYINPHPAKIPEVLRFVLDRVVNSPRFPEIGAVKVIGFAEHAIRNDLIVMYADTEEGLLKAKDILIKYVEANPESFQDVTPPMSEPIARGVAIAREPIGLTYNIGAGGFRDVGKSEHYDFLVKVLDLLDSSTEVPGELDELLTKKLSEDMSEVMSSENGPRDVSKAVFDVYREYMSQLGIGEGEALFTSFSKSHKQFREPGKVLVGERNVSFSSLRSYLVADALLVSGNVFEDFVSEVMKRFVSGRINFWRPSRNLGDGTLV
ncbi:hypothetical protein FUAX_13770 [Fulvitalea axinellae]|uniref:Uncharacterized protein n=1 Tax=Fulvitalea axinellae TaxID=1182444 RepID=A0AAU9CI58_9BACT|nr:hypothetical protein FUAX_13770 [Fulvitalea axinellae]